MHSRGQQRARYRTRGAATRLLVALVALITLLPGPLAADRAPRADDYAVIVNPLVTTSDVTLAHLREMFLGTRRAWDDGARVVVIVQSPGSRTRAVVLRALYQMDESAFKRYWIARTFRGEGANDGGPTLVASDATARRLTASIPGAVAIVPASEVDGGVRVLKVDGRSPGADGYPLTGGGP